ncbi:hypothetical protein ACHAXT_012282 [Thalassiosira profunda]
MEAEARRQAQLDAPGGFDHASAIAIHEERLAPDGSSFVASFVVDGVGRRLPQGSDPSFHVERDDQEASTLPCSFEGPESRCPFGDNCKYQHPWHDNDRRLAMPRRFEGGMFQVADERRRAAVERGIDKATRELEEMEKQKMQQEMQQEMKREAFQEAVRQGLEDSKPPTLGRAARLMQADREKDLYLDAERRLADYSRDQSSRALQALDQNGNNSTARHGASSTGRRGSKSKTENAPSEADLQELALAFAGARNSDEAYEILRDCLGELSIERSRREVFRDVADSSASPDVARLLRGSSIQNADTQDAFINLFACAPLTPDEGPVRIKLKASLEDTLRAFTIMMEDIDSSNKPRLDAAVLENEWNNDDEVMGRAMQGELPGHLKDSLNLSNPYSRFTLALFMWRYCPPVTWDCPSWKDKMYELQCCLIVYFQIAPRYLSREYRHEKCRDTFTHLIKGLDLWPFELVKGTEAELNTQIQRYVRLFRLKSKSELALFAVVKLMRHQILHMLQHGKELRVGIASAESSLVVLGESRRDRHLQQRETEMGILCTLFHSQAIWMGLHKSERQCPPHVREALDRNLTLVLSPVIGIQEEDSDFCTVFHHCFGDDPDDEKQAIHIELGLLSSLRKRIEAANAWTDPRRLLTDESDKLLFEGQCATHGMETLMERMRHIGAAHKMQNLASQWELGQTMPPELLSGICEVAGVLHKRPEDILRMMFDRKQAWKNPGKLKGLSNARETTAKARARIAANEGTTDDYDRIECREAGLREVNKARADQRAGKAVSKKMQAALLAEKFGARNYTPDMRTLHSQLTEATADSAGDHTSLMEAISIEVALARISTVVGTLKHSGHSNEYRNAASNERVSFQERNCTDIGIHSMEGKESYIRGNYFLVTAKKGESQDEAQIQGHREARVCYDIVADLFPQLNRVTICNWLSEIVSSEEMPKAISSEEEARINAAIKEKAAQKAAQKVAKAGK